ncbi:DUF2029 domain-containing protein, partial [Brachyspira pilosicoli]|nr:DUF2029 domain-containing protein [Brachyspira pilosicoli]
INTNEIIKNNNFIKEIKIDKQGSPFGNLITYNVFDFEIINNVNYILKIKKYIYLYIVLFMFFILLVLFYCYHVSDNKVFIKKQNMIIKVIIFLFLFISFFYMVKINSILSLFIPILIFIYLILLNPKNLFYNELTFMDWIIFIYILLMCFLLFNQYIDLQHTYMSSYAYLNGHFLDFYSYNKSQPFNWANANNYMPSTYIVFAIWNLPFKIFNIGEKFYHYNQYIMFYNKLLIALFYVASMFIVYKILKQLSFNEKKSKITTYIWATSPLAIFSSFIFGQYDIFTFFFTLLGILFYFKKDDNKFILFFAIAITFKYFPLFVFIILLIAREKSILKIIKYSIYVFIPFIIETFIYIYDPAFRTGVWGFGAISYVLRSSISGLDIKLFPLFWIILCGYVLFTDIRNNKDFNKYIFFYLSILSFLLFGLSFWHPMWLIFITFFLAFGTAINKRYDVFLLIDIAFMFFSIMFTMNIWGKDYMEFFIEYGILKDIGIRNATITMSQIFKDKYSISFTFISGILLLNAIFKHPKFCFEDINEDISNSMFLIRLRFIFGLAIFIIPAFISAISVFI